MRKVILHAPAIRNDGSYVDSGTTVDVGDAPDQVTSARTRVLMRNRFAVLVR